MMRDELGDLVSFRRCRMNASLMKHAWQSELCCMQSCLFGVELGDRLLYNCSNTVYYCFNAWILCTNTMSESDRIWLIPHHLTCTTGFIVSTDTVVLMLFHISAPPWFRWTFVSLRIKALPLNRLSLIQSGSFDPAARRTRTAFMMDRCYGRQLSGDAHWVGADNCSYVIYCVQWKEAGRMCMCSFWLTK